MTRGIAIFDIDGTLTRTNRVDEECYAQAVQDVLGVSNISTDWGSYRHSSDNGILHEIIETHCKRAPCGRDFRAVRARFIELVSVRSRSDSEGWEEVAGAREILRELPSMGWTIAIATGGWGPSALRKLECVNISISNISFACADHAFARLDIIRWALRGAVGVVKSSTIPVVYIGDGVWDIDAARVGGYGFVGIGHGDRAVLLAAAGSQVVLSDYLDRSKFEHALTSACLEYERR
ncbi:MAG: HAD family hydrolase [Planctomycetota bacterium]|nr:HAD family hydrolase [Planctomycetota bacterium]MDA1262458.1 HAD family hydrolase [Planctomycetota bacterium]